MQAQMSAHKVAVDSLRDQADKHLQVELKAQKEILDKEQGRSGEIEFTYCVLWVVAISMYHNNDGFGHPKIVIILKN